MFFSYGASDHQSQCCKSVYQSKQRFEPIRCVKLPEIEVLEDLPHREDRFVPSCVEWVDVVFLEFDFQEVRDPELYRPCR